VRSRFVFDARVYDAEYFRERMAQTRQRRAQQLESVSEVTIHERSDALPPVTAELDRVPGLIEALNGLVADPLLATWLPLMAKGFDLERYIAHIQKCLHEDETDFEDIAPLESHERLDRIWRFVAVIFMAHDGAIELRQSGMNVTVIRIGLDRERQGVLAKPEISDGLA